MTLSFKLLDDFVLPYSTQTPPFGFVDAGGNSLGEITFLRTYSRVKTDGTKERWWEVCRRVIEGMYSIQKDWARQNRLPWNDNKAQASAKEAYERMFNLKWTPAGRGLWVTGTDMIHERNIVAGLYNCFTGDTKVVTKSGVARLDEIVGEEHEVWADGAWHRGVVSEFKEGQVNRIQFKPFFDRSNHVIAVDATPNHRWVLEDGTETTNLSVGDKVVSSGTDVDINSDEYHAGVIHGIVFGDGTRHAFVRSDGAKRFHVRLCGDRADEMKQYFSHVTYPQSADGDAQAYVLSQKELKEFPVGESPEYVSGFIYGWLLADGNNLEEFGGKLDTQHVDAYSWLSDHAAYGGYVVVGHNYHQKPTNYGKRKNPLHRITLRKSKTFKVVSITELDVQPTYCFTVPSVGKFTLASGLITGNCAFISTGDIDHRDPGAIFAWVMDALMLGVGVGFDTLGAHKNILIKQPEPSDDVYVIEDSREGWHESIRLLVNSYLRKNRQIRFDYSQIRPYGEPIKGFGGTASGPGPLIKVHEQLDSLFASRIGETLDTKLITDIVNLIGTCVVAGNVRRCLPGDAPIQTSRGVVSMTDIEVGDVIVTGGERHPVTGKVYSGIQDVFTVRHRFGSFKATANHRVAVFTDINKFEYKTVSQLELGDRIVFDGYGVDFTDKRLPYMSELLHHNANSFDVPEFINEDVAWLFGLIQGDGYTGSGVEIATATHELESLERAKSIVEENFGVSGSISSISGKNAVRLRVNSAGLGRWLQANVKTSNQELRVPEFIANSSRSVREAYLAGVFDSDGRMRSDGPIQIASTIYKRFADDLAILLSSLGIGSIVSSHENNHGRIFYTVDVVGNTNKYASSGILHKSASGKQKEQSYDSPIDFSYPYDIVRNYQFSHYGRASTLATVVKHYQAHEKHYPSPVMSVEHTSTEDTWDIEVDDIHRFTAYGVVMHNSATIAIGEPGDDDFANLKNPEVFPYRQEWSWMSNNTIALSHGDKFDYESVEDLIANNGEPGFMWLDTSREYGRIADPATNADHRVKGLNPCLAADNYLFTEDGLITFGEAFESHSPNRIVSDTRITFDRVGEQNDPNNWKIDLQNTGSEIVDATHVFLTQHNADIVKVSTSNGMSVRVTPDHLIATKRGMVEAQDLVANDKILVTPAPLPDSSYLYPADAEGRDAFIMGLIAGGGTFSSGKETETAHIDLWGDDRHLVSTITEWLSEIYVENSATIKCPSNRGYSTYNVTHIEDKKKVRISSSFLAAYLKKQYGFERSTKHVVPKTIMRNARSSASRLYVSALAFADGTVNFNAKPGSSSIRINQSNKELLSDVQMILLANGITSSIYLRREAGDAPMPDGRGGSKIYSRKTNYELVIMMHAYEFTKFIGFASSYKQPLAESEFTAPSRKRNAYTSVISVEPDGKEDVYCLTEPKRHTLVANGLSMRQCAEITLESYETCNLVELHLNRHDSIEDYLRTIKFAYLYAKTITLLPTHWPQTNAVIQRNRRIGTSQTGIAGFVDHHGIDEFRHWSDAGYHEIQRYDNVYSEWLGIRESIKTTTVKPSGSVSLLSGSTPGVHWPSGGEYYMRAIRFSNTDQLLHLFKFAGYKHEPDLYSDNTTVVYFPMKTDMQRSERDVSIYEKIHLAATAQQWWADNAVSVTVTFDPKTEKADVPRVLNMYEGQLKSVSFLPMSNDTYPQMPYTQITQEEYESYLGQLRQIDFGAIYDGADNLEAQGEKYCSNDSCAI